MSQAIIAASAAWHALAPFAAAGVIEEIVEARAEVFRSRRGKSKFLRSQIQTHANLGLIQQSSAK
jgi:hypothetical protein